MVVTEDMIAHYVSLVSRRSELATLRNRLSVSYMSTETSDPRMSWSEEHSLSGGVSLKLSYWILIEQGGKTRHGILLAST